MAYYPYFFFTMQILFLILGISSAIFILIIYAGHRLNIAASNKLKSFFAKIDKEYEAFVKPYLAQKVIEDTVETLDIKNTSEQFIQLVRGDIETLISVINTTDITDAKIRYKSPNFQMVVHKAEELCGKRYAEKRYLNESEKAILYQSFSDCIRYNLEAQLIRIKSGTF